MADDNTQNEETTQTKIKLPELLIIDDNQVIHHQGACKLQLNAPSKILLVSPENEEYKLISIPFESECVKQHNILCIFNADKIHNLALIFKNSTVCENVYSKIFKKEVSSDEKEESNKTYNEKFIHPLCDTILRNLDSNKFLKQQLIDTTQLYNGIEKEKFIEVLKLRNVYDLLFPIHVTAPLPIVSKKAQKRRHEINRDDQFSDETDSDNNHECGNTKTSSKNLKRSRRKQPKINEEEVIQALVSNPNSDNEIEHTPPFLTLQPNKSHKRRIVKPPNFEIVPWNEKGITYEKLIIYDSNNRELCHEYFKDATSFMCQGCKLKDLTVRAQILKEEAGNDDCVEILGAEHICELRKVRKQKILRKPNYEIKKEYINGIKGEMRERLIIFDPKNRSLCYKYAPNRYPNSYYCIGCIKKKNFRFRALIFNKGTEEEYVEIEENGHICDLQEYKEMKEFEIVKATNFEIQTTIFRGKEQKKLIIFNLENRNLCYEYLFKSRRNMYVCDKCKLKKAYVNAKLCQNETTGEEEYIRLGKNTHVCSLQPYKTIENREIIKLDASKFNYKEKNGVGRVYIFVSNKNKDLVYEFSRQNGNDFYCLGCRKHNRKENARINLLKNEAGEYYVEVKNEKHLCEPRKYSDGEENIVKFPDFHFYKNSETNNCSPPDLVIFISNNKNNYYHYFFDQRKQVYYCRKCKPKSIHPLAKVNKNPDDGSEYLTLGKVKHVCEPLKYSELKESKGFEILSKSGYNFEKTMEKIDENRIIRSGGFEFQRNKKGILNSKLVIFYLNERKLCYEYFFDKTTQRFMCSKCAIQKKGSKAQFNEKENYVILNEIEHVCKPVKYEKQEDIVRKPRYILIEPNEKTNTLQVQNLFIFMDETQEFCYRFSLDIKGLFYCRACQKLKNYFSAKICFDKDDEEYIHFGQGKHICGPQKYVAEKFQKMVYLSNEFEIQFNSNGIPASKIIVFLKNNKNFGFEFSKKQSSLPPFYCVPCSKMGKYVSAYLHPKENDGEFELQTVMESEHICGGTNLVEKGKLIKNGFEFQNLEDESKIIKVDHPENKSFYYKFEFDNKKQTFFCAKCKEKNKFVTAKICEGKEGKKFLLMNNCHYCIPI